MDITFRTLGAWGPGKGSNLQPSEVDNNFWSLAQAIVSLQVNPAMPNGISSITVSGTQMYITLSDGTVLGPYPLPVLAFHWRGEWMPNSPYFQLDVFDIDNVGIFLVQIPYTSGDTFDPNQTDGAGNPILLQLFGSTNASLSGLSDVQLNNLSDGDALVWVAADSKWENFFLGSMAYQDADAVAITGGTITGMPAPVTGSDVATKSYVDGAVVGGAPIAPYDMMANIQGVPAPAAPHTLSDYLDAALASTAIGNIVYRTSSGWIALAAGPAGDFLQSQGAGLDVIWSPAPGGVTSIAAGTGIALSPSPIIATGSVSLAGVPDGMLLANITGSTAAPVPLTLSQFLDHVYGSSRGTLLTRNIAGWIALAPGTSGYYLKTQGPGADAMWDAPAGSGTVTSVAAGTGLAASPSPIVGAGTMSLATITTGTLLANISGSTAAPAPTAVTLLLDNIFGTSQGLIVYRAAGAWAALTPGTSGQILTTAGAGANPAWANAPITGASIANNTIVSNILGHTAAAAANSLSAIFDAILSSSRGAIIFRTNSGWVALAPGTAGQVLTTGGASADPSWGGVATNLDGLSDVAVTTPVQYDMLVYGVTAGLWTNQRRPYHIAGYTPGTMTANQSLLFHKFSKNATIPVNFGAYLGHASQASGSASATATTVITFAKATAAAPTSFTNVGTVTFAAGTLAATWSTQAAITFAQGDVLRVRGPATPDVSFADFHLTLVGYET